MFDEKRKNKTELKISVLGDSISTYEGWNPYGYAVYYKDDVAYENGIFSVNDVWWKKTIDSVGGKLCVNNSYSGSFVSGMGATSACSEERCSFLDGGDKPDLILVYMGTNDRGYGVKIGTEEAENAQCFYGGYRIMLKRLKVNYPTAKIVCATLLVGYLKNYKYIPMAPEDMKTVERYNEAIRLAVNEEGCFLADIALSDERYETLDYCHPTAEGHKTLAKLWIEHLNNLL